MKAAKYFNYILLFGAILMLFQNCNSKEEDSSKKEKSPEEVIQETLGTTMSFDEMPDTMQVAHMVRVWNGCHNSKFIDNLQELYASRLFFYGEEKSSYEAINVKKRVFQKYPDYFQRIIGGIRVSKISPSEYRCDFTKYIRVGSITAPVPAYLIFKKIEENKWAIIAESDPETDIKHKELKDSMEVLKVMFSPSMTEIKGNFSGKGNETIFVFPPENPNCTDCITSLFFSNELLPPLDIKGAKSVQLLNEGDLDGDGNDEFSVLFNNGNEGRMRVYSFKRGEWVLMKKFSVDYQQLISDEVQRTNAIQLAGSGYIYIQEKSGDSTKQEKVNIWDF